MSQQYNLGKVALTPRGAYDANATYEKLDIVTLNGSSYIVLQSVTGVTPPNSTYYQVIASKGNNGANGSAATLRAGTISMLPVGSSPTVTNSGTTSNAIFNFGIPYSSVENGSITHVKIASGAVHLDNLNIEVTEVLDNKANVDGFYEQMTVGNAEQIVSSVGIVDKVPYNFRTSGGTSDIGDRETDMIVGGTIVYNELLYPQSKTESDIRSTGVDAIFSDRKITLNGTASEWGFTNIRYASTRKFFPADHVFYINGLTGRVALEIASNGSPAGLVSPFYNDKILKIPNYTGGTASWIRIRFYKNDVFDNDTIEPNVFDLTKMFGSSIADYVYSLEQTTAGAGVAWVKKLFPNTVYPYNEGTLWSVKTSAHIMTGFNQWDEQWELGGLVYSTGEPSSANDRIRSKNFCRCLPNTVYYAKAPSPYLTIWWYDYAQRFLGYESAQNIVGTLTVTSPATAMYFKLVLAGNATTYENDICINISWDGERNGEYEPYVQHTYELDPNLELRGMPKLDQNNKLYYDGDTYESNGTVTRKYGIVDLGTLNWQKTSGKNNLFNTASILSTAGYGGSNTLVCHAICSKYVADNILNTYNNEVDKTVSFTETGYCYIEDSAYSDAATFKAAMSGVYLVYKLDTPTTETANTYTNPQIVDDFGTEEYVDTRDLQIPVGHSTFYQANLKSKIEMSPNSPDGDGVYVVQQEDGINTYVPLIIPNELPDAPSEDGTYRLVCTVSNGVKSFSWVSN